MAYLSTHLLPAWNLDLRNLDHSDQCCVNFFPLSITYSHKYDIFSQPVMDSARFFSCFQCVFACYLFCVLYIQHKIQCIWAGLSHGMFTIGALQDLTGSGVMRAHPALHVHVFSHPLRVTLSRHDWLWPHSYQLFPPWCLAVFGNIQGEWNWWMDADPRGIISLLYGSWEMLTITGNWHSFWLFC